MFVVGMARSGTTALLRLLHDTGDFECLTYRDIPFVLMPRIWARLSRPFYKESQAVERAHGDSVMIEFDSPEGFESVFWRTFAAGEYHMAEYLKIHEPSPEILERFRTFVALVASRSNGNPRRYLSKNNNNLIRLEALRKVLPDASILVMYRDPFQTALSSHRQHLRFCEAQAKDSFVLDYMNWLEHHEFGLGHKPFRFGSRLRREFDLRDPNYWLQYWIEVYTHVLANRTNFDLLSYESLCSAPERSVADLFRHLSLSADPVRMACALKRASDTALPLFDERLTEESRCVYRSLRSDDRNIFHSVAAMRAT